MSLVISRAQDVEKHHMIIPVRGLGESSHICIIIFGKHFSLPVLKIFHCSDLKKSLVDVIGDRERSSVVYGCEHHILVASRELRLRRPREDETGG